jgi:hypothetical protein
MYIKQINYMPNYQNTVIYKIVCNDLSIKDLYVRHTTNFRKRKRIILNPPNKNRGNQNNQPVLDVMILVESI